MKDRNRTSGIVGIVLGSLMLLSSLTRLANENVRGTGAYFAGGVTSLVFAAVMLGAGVYYLRKASRDSS